MVSDMPSLSEVTWSANLYGEKRQPAHIMDYGDDDTVGLHLKRKDYELLPKKVAQGCKWGIFFGGYKGKWYVGVTKVIIKYPLGMFEYDTLDALKKDWALDQDLNRRMYQWK